MWALNLCMCSLLKSCVHIARLRGNADCNDQVDTSLVDFPSHTGCDWNRDVLYKSACILASKLDKSACLLTRCEAIVTYIDSYIGYSTVHLIPVLPGHEPFTLLELLTSATHFIKLNMSIGLLYVFDNRLVYPILQCLQRTKYGAEACIFIHGRFSRRHGMSRMQQ